ncbi:hypothetical protein GDO81_010685 [Engystomops pustulosus]|uniref:Uncharacterized protein n=1 Tax=Engystomops pustulosus TaxID=76066 RepID=A0AAV7C306_ENGPU|nr:hypothetical protein GDO81_010685 [Engystomops pustulosus]
MRNRKRGEPGASPDPRSQPAKRYLFQKLRKNKGKKSRLTLLGKIKEENVEPNNLENPIETPCISEDESVSKMPEKRPLSSDSSMEKELVKVKETTSGHSVSSSPSPHCESYVTFGLTTDDTECRFSSPEQVREEHSASSSSSLYCELYETFDECSSSSSEVLEDDSQIDAGETVFGQGIEGNKNSTLMEISRAQAISEMTGPFNISEISPVYEDCVSESKASHLNHPQFFDPASILVPGLIREASLPEESQRRTDHPVDCASASTFILGKPVYKIRKNDLYGQNQPRPCGNTTSEAKISVATAPLEVPVNRGSHIFGHTREPISNPRRPQKTWNCPPKPVQRTMKRVHFCDPLTTEIPYIDPPDSPTGSCTGPVLSVPPTLAEVSAILKDISTNTSEMFLHHPMLRLIEKSGKRYF